MQKWRFSRSISGQFERSDFFNTIGRNLPLVKGCFWPTEVACGCPLLADSVEKVGFSDRLNSGTTTTGEPTHHIEWFL
ncbi:hypothetical protein, partial [Pseudomonas sp. EL_65y_Pfl1_R32]|uniref:hypothetical protein n=1 Tax=Pseudomonas sp. EL_65y_Pfl1_R32 TaxID=3088696 RepID=UPI0030D870DF